VTKYNDDDDDALLEYGEARVSLHYLANANPAVLAQEGLQMRHVFRMSARSTTPNTRFPATSAKCSAASAMALRWGGARSQRDTVIQHQDTVACTQPVVVVVTMRNREQCVRDERKQHEITHGWRITDIRLQIYGRRIVADSQGRVA
jgi:hypothetical protein